MSGLTRRQLLVGGAAGTLALCLRGLIPDLSDGRATGTALAATLADDPSYTQWEDVYRAAWRWDRVVRGTHLRANCFSACAFDLYVKDGVVWREEQADVYARQAAGLPDYAPRGCQKGSCYSALMVAPGRITYPLERVGERGSGQWRRISWEAAFTRVADAILDAVQEHGIETVVYDNGTSNVDWGPSYGRRDAALHLDGRHHARRLRAAPATWRWARCRRGARRSSTAAPTTGAAPRPSSCGTAIR